MTEEEERQLQLYRIDQHISRLRAEEVGVSCKLAKVQHRVKLALEQRERLQAQLPYSTHLEQHPVAYRYTQPGRDPVVIVAHNIIEAADEFARILTEATGQFTVMPERPKRELPEKE